MMRRRDAARVTRLRSGAPKIDDAPTPLGEPADYRQLRQLRDLDDRLRVERNEALLEELDRAIVDEAVAGRTSYQTSLKVNRSTVWRRIKRLLKKAAYLQRFAEVLLGEAKPQEWPVIKAMATALASGGRQGLDIEGYNRLAQMYRGGADAHRHLFPLTGLRMERQGDKIIISGPGPLSAALADAVRSGKAERIYPGPPRCLACGRYVSRASTGRPQKYCSERCRSRYRRRR